MLVDLRPQRPTFPLIPTGSLIQSNSKMGHEIVAGPLYQGRQVVGHSEPGAGVHLEFIDCAAGRYQFTNILPPVSNQHGAQSWARLTNQLGDPWAALDNCQHTAREAYYGEASSPVAAGIGIAAVLAGLWWFGNRD
jgi:hypothetical protein